MPVVDQELLRSIPLFELLDEQELAALAQQLEIEHYIPNQVIFTAGEAGGEMYLIQKGRVEIFMRDKSHERIVLDVVERGEIFGELSLLDDQERSASSKALDETTLVVIDRDDLLALVKAHPAAALDMMSMLGKRIRATDLLVRNRVITRNVNEEMEEERPGFGTRLADVLTRVAGDIRFAYVNAFLFIAWLVWNSGAIHALKPFDPPPYGVLTMIVSLEAIFLSLFVLISQNRQAERDRIRNEIEYQVNVKAELEIRELHDHLEDIDGMLVRYFSRPPLSRKNGPITPPEELRDQNP
jgi:CRP/FNR family cyclic AMP-dependent transcriptional regulator